MRLRDWSAVALTASVLMLTAGVARAAPDGPPSIAPLVARLSPAVVNISSIHHSRATGAAPPSTSQGTPLKQFFDDGSSDSSAENALPPDAESLGSGFIISADGVIVTNNHVIDGADDIEIYMTDGTHLPARVLGADSKTDLAVLKVNAKKPLPFVEFDDSDKAEVGDWVVAIGNPFGLGGSVTLGIVSARDRDIQSGPYDAFIQTDASINQGNSGGPLFDMNGKVLGINSAIVAEGGASLGIGFAIPANLAKPVVRQLREFGETRRGWLGVGIQAVTDSIAESLGRSDTHGAMVTDVSSPGPSVGLIDEGDIIVSFDGKPIVTMHDLPRLVAEAEVGRKVPVVLVRDGKEITVDITLGRLPDENQASAKPTGDGGKAPAQKPAAPARTLGDVLGFNLAPIDAANRKTYQLPNVQGLVITSVKAGSDADEQGLSAGLVVTEANKRKVLRLADVQSALDDMRKAGRSAMLLRVVDPAGQGRYIAVRIDG